MAEVKNNVAMDRLYELYDNHGSWFTVAEKLGISASYLSDVVRGRREISAKLAQKLGFVKKCEFVESDHGR